MARANLLSVGFPDHFWLEGLFGNFQKGNRGSEGAGVQDLMRLGDEGLD